MKAVPSVLRYLGKCTAGLSSNCVYTMLNSATDEVAPSVAREVHNSFFSEIVHNPYRTMKTVNLFVRQVGRPQRLEVEVGFSHYLTLNWINIYKLRLRLT